MKTRISERHMLMGLVIGFSVLLVLRSVSNVFVYPLILVGAATVAFLPLGTCLPVLCFLLPFANIIKISPGQISLFTVFFAIYVLRIIFKTGKLNRMFLLTAFIFAGYCLAVSGPERIVTIVTMVCGFTMLREATESDEYDYHHVLYAFCFGIIISSAIGAMRDYLPIVKTFSVDAIYKVGHEEYASRFVGLGGNPNYYTMDVTVALGCLVTTICTEKMRPIYIVLFAVLSVFGLMSVSKSFLIVLIIMIVILLLNSMRQGAATFLKFSIALVVAGILILTFAQEAIDTYIFRLTEDATSDLSSITTGRSDILVEYVKAMLKDLRVLFFGEGLGAILSQGTHNLGTHNTYLDLFYYLGLVGTFLYLFALKSSVAIKRFPRNILYYVPIFIMLIRFWGIGMLIQDALWYYMVVICLLLAEGNKKENQRIEKVQKQYEN